MPFRAAIKTQTFKPEDLIGRSMNIRSFKDGHLELIVGHDIDTGEIFVFKEINHPIAEYRPNKSLDDKREKAGSNSQDSE